MINEAKPAVDGPDRLNQPAESMNPGRAEALLKPIIKYWIVELVEPLEFEPRETFEFITDAEGDLCMEVGMTRVLELCQELHRAEDCSQSEWYATRFYQLNHEFFGGALAAYRVRAVYDLAQWVSEPSDKSILGHVDNSQRRIIVGVNHHYNRRKRDARLIHLMAHAKTETTTDDAEPWRREMKRLSETDAYVFQRDVDHGVEHRGRVAHDKIRSKKDSTCMATAASKQRVDLARRCLVLIRRIAAYGAISETPDVVSYALHELRQALRERVGREDDRLFDHLASYRNCDLARLLQELGQVDTFAGDLAVCCPGEVLPRGTYIN